MQQSENGVPSCFPEIQIHSCHFRSLIVIVLQGIRTRTTGGLRTSTQAIAVHRSWRNAVIGYYSCSMQYSCDSVRINIWSPTIAGEASMVSPRSFTAKTSPVGPCLTTTTTPSREQK